MSLPDIPNKLKLALRVPLVDEYPAVEGANNEQGMLFQEYYPNNSFIFVLIVLPRVYFLQKISSLAAVFPHKPSSISHKKFTTFVPELRSSDMSIVLMVMQFGEDLLQGAREQVVDPNVVGSKQEDHVRAGANSEIEN